MSREMTNHKHCKNCGAKVHPSLTFCNGWASMGLMDPIEKIPHMSMKSCDACGWKGEINTLARCTK